MDEKLLEKAIQQAKANVELETTPISEQIINNVIKNNNKDSLQQKKLIKKENNNGNKQ